MRSLHTKAHTFASHTSPSTDQSLQKSVLFASPKRNSFFSSRPLVFYFFATHNRHQNSWTETAKAFTNKDLTMTEDRRPAYNSVLPQLAVTCNIEAECSYQTFVQVESEVLRNRQLRQHAERCEKTKCFSQSIKISFCNLFRLVCVGSPI